MSQKQTSRIACSIADNLAAGGIGRVFGVTDGAQRGGVQQGAIIKMQNEDGRIGGGGIDFRQSRQAFFGKLMFAKAADDPNPMGWGGDLRLALQHRHGIGQGRHPFPAQFQVIIQTAPNEVNMAVDQAGDHAATMGIDLERVGPCGGDCIFHGPNDPEVTVPD